MICDDPFYTGICPARTEDGQCVSKFPCSHKVEPPKPPTNADRIRAMSDEELAWELMLWRCEAVARHHGISSVYPDTQKTILEWLQQPAEEDDHDERKENENV